MTLPDVVRTVRWMIRDTLRQSIATKLFWVMLAVTAVATALCLSVNVTGGAPGFADYEVPGRLPRDQVVEIGLGELRKEGKLPTPVPPAGTPEGEALRAKAYAAGEAKAKADGVWVVSGEMTLGFGAVKVPVAKDREDSVRLLVVWLAATVADNLGLLLALLWTAGFLPTFLEPQSATVLLAKPAPRWAVLLGKYLGVVLFVGLYGAVFVGATWAALGLKTGVWFAAYWLAVPLLVVNFGVFYAVSAFLAVWTRSTVAAAFGVLLFWLLCWAMNYTHHRLTLYPAEGMTAASHFLLDAGYWILPKPLDLSGIFHDAMRAEGFAVKPEELRRMEETGRYHPGLSVLASCGFAAVTLGLAAYEFEMTDY